ncbi:hypothetical protein ACHAW5_005567 [Stephanodiscus triporus]|uniref:Uncharacterized protein n=1 Tax=Stephanodiscus triporus TaxID=2934178 RepID=A0ABD3P652_9STRA
MATDRHHARRLSTGTPRSTSAAMPFFHTASALHVNKAGINDYLLCTAGHGDIGAALVQMCADLNDNDGDGPPSRPTLVNGYTQVYISRDAILPHRVSPAIKTRQSSMSSRCMGVVSDTVEHDYYNESHTNTSLVPLTSSLMNALHRLTEQAQDSSGQICIGLIKSAFS